MAFQKTRRERLQRFSAVSQRTIDKRVPRFIYEKIKDHKLRWSFTGKALDSRFGRMNSLEQFVKREIAVERHNDLPVEDKIFRAKLVHSFDDLREIATKRLPGFRTNFNDVCVTEYQRAEAVPLWLELPVGTVGNSQSAFGLHRRIVKRYRQAHRTDSSWNRPRC